MPIPGITAKQKIDPGHTVAGQRPTLRRSEIGLLHDMMKDGTRLIFWIDIVILLVLSGLILAGQWDFVIALFIALVILNYFDRWQSRRR